MRGGLRGWMWFLRQMHRTECVRMRHSPGSGTHLPALRIRIVQRHGKMPLPGGHDAIHRSLHVAGHGHHIRLYESRQGERIAHPGIQSSAGQALQLDHTQRYVVVVSSELSLFQHH